MAHEKPVEKIRRFDHQFITTLIAVMTPVLGLAYFLWQLDHKVSDLNKAVTTINGDEKPPRIDVIETRHSELKKDADKRIAAVETQLTELKKDADKRIAAVETQLSDVANKLRQTVSRVPALEIGPSELSRDIEWNNFDTVYVFKHTFDFPNPSFDVSEDEAWDLVCPRDERPTTDRLNHYKERLTAFDDDVELNFHTIVKEGTLPVQTIIRQETACYKHLPKETDGGPVVAQDIRITPAPVKILIQAESAMDSHKNAPFNPPYYLSSGHDDGDSKTFLFTGLPDKGLQVHSLTAAVSDREHGTRLSKRRRYCSDYGKKIATGELDRCDFELFVFTHLNSR